MPSHDTTVQSVVQRVVNKKAGGTTTVYDIIDGNGVKWSTFKQPVANEANRLVGQRVEMMVRIEQNGQYENKLIDDIRAFGFNGGSAQAEQPRGGYAPAQAAMQAQGIPEAQSAPATQAPTIPTANWLDEKQWAIMRQAAAKVSAQISQDPASFWRNLDPLITYFATGFMPPEFDSVGNPPQDPHVPEQEYSFIPPGTSEGFGNGPNPDSDIPF